MDDEQISTVADGPMAADGSSVPLFMVRVSQGPDAGQSLTLDWSTRPSYLVGQGPLCDLRLQDRRASRRHLSIAPQGPLLRVTDLGSSNGTRIGGVYIVEALLAGGEVINIGDSQLRVVRAPVAAPVPAAGRRHFGRVLGASFEMQRLFELAEGLSLSNLSVIIEGETGTGKELVAEAIHEASPRAAGPLVVFDCAGSREQLEAGLFGHDQPGALERAHGGTFVFSEVSDLDPALQARLVAFLQSGVVQRGSGESRRVDVRLISTTCRDVDREVQEGRLRDDLVSRLAGARLEVPPLRRRHGDVEFLVTHFWKLYGGAGTPPKALLLKLQRAPWSGNVRELQNTVARALSVGTDDAEELAPRIHPRPRLGSHDDVIAKALAMDLPLPRARDVVVSEFERRYVEGALEKHGGNVTRAAAASGLTRRYFHILLSQIRPSR
jgi:DNA-binding NtrC family response regulator